MEDHYRRRLTHSLEVAQIATTLARAFRVNEIATEAIALAHDIGHTPFGHGGEDELDDLLWRENVQPTTGGTLSGPPFDGGVPLYGFNHCVQAVEVVARIQSEYGGHPGLNLSFDVRDGILKHIFPKDPENGPCLYGSLSNVVKLGEYAQYGDNLGTIEGQCVWLADKMAYLFGDLEDGLRSLVFRFEKVRRSPFVRRVWEYYRTLRGSSEKLVLSNMKDYLEFRRKALAALIVNAIKASVQRIQDISAKDVDEIRGQGTRIVHLEEDLQERWREFYARFMKERLFVDDGVMACEYKARKIVRDLFHAYVDSAELIPLEYRERTGAAYRPFLSTPREMRLMTVTNYLAGMTDSFATEQHKRLFMSSERASFV